MTQKVFTIAMIGASDIISYSNREWPIKLCQTLQVGQSSLIRPILFGLGSGSTYDISNGQMAKLASIRADVAVLSFYGDAYPPRSVSAAQALANMYTSIDLIRAARSDTAIFLIKTWKVSAAQEATTYPNLADYWAAYATAAANRPGVGIIDAYTGVNPDDHPEDFTVGDPIHPQLSYFLRTTIPQAVSAIEPLIN